MIPIFTFFSLLIINTYRLLHEQVYILKSDPQCGFTAGGREECTWDCEIPSRTIYKDPTCMRECVDFPRCFLQLMEDHTENGGVCSGSNGDIFYDWPVSSTPCAVYNSTGKLSTKLIENRIVRIFLT